MKFINIANAKKKDFTINKPGKYVFWLKNYSGDVEIKIMSPLAEVYIFGLYVGKGAEQFKLHTIQHHKAGNSMSDLLIKGVFYDTSKFLYDGLIRIDKGAQQSNAYQKNQNLIMSDGVFVDSRPFLEIQANDVRCTHGSTTGRPSKEELFYITTRGINPKKAEKVVVEGFLQDILNRMYNIGVNTSALTI